METEQGPKQQVQVPFVCPVCTAANAVHLISLSRAGGVDCSACGKWLKAADVMRAIHSPRDEQAGASRGAAPSPRARVATRGGTRPAQPVSRRDAIVWPPTPESRAAARPLPTRRQENVSR